MAYAAYLRIYEPVSAFHEPDRSRWVAYAASSTRPRRRDPLAVELAEALRRAITTPRIAVPERESEHAYVRCVDGTRAERWLSLGDGRAGIDGAARGECELAVAMYMRARDRWRAFADFEQAN
jgi:hypothetical protein